MNRYRKSYHKAQDNHWIAISHWKGEYERLREKYQRLHKRYLEMKRLHEHGIVKKSRGSP